jgi:hypothetical protein
MSDRDDTRNETFLARWSRVKNDARDAHSAPSASAAPARDEEDKAPQLPPVEELTLESDFSGFFHPKVDEDVRRQALRKLFSDPHFNAMDGLDVYIDDYSKSEPIPAAMLAGLAQAQRILAWASEGGDAKAAADVTAAPVSSKTAVAESKTADEVPLPGVGTLAPREST